MGSNGLEPEDGKFYVIKLWLSDTEKTLLKGLAERFPASRGSRRGFGHSVAQMVRVGFNCLAFHETQPEPPSAKPIKKGSFDKAAKRQGLSIVSESHIRRPRIRSSTSPQGPLKYDED